jgi:cytochrome c biogenesis protein CcmG, thiol:disulfide interchange protein DsbE
MHFWLPLLGLAVLTVALAVGLTLNPREVPSPLIGQPAPSLVLPVLGEERELPPEALQGQPTLVNYWASWCAPCLEEHPLFVRLARDYGVRIIGVNYKDAPADATRWLRRHGDPYEAVVQDIDGATGLDWGVYGVPETYVVDADGIIRFKKVGPMDEKTWREKVAPLMHSATAARSVP